jgi:hypothetical protein
MYDRKSCLRDGSLSICHMTSRLSSSWGCYGVMWTWWPSGMKTCNTWKYFVKNRGSERKTLTKCRRYTPQSQKLGWRGTWCKCQDLELGWPMDNPTLAWEVTILGFLEDISEQTVSTHLEISPATFSWLFGWARESRMVTRLRGV